MARAKATAGNDAQQATGAIASATNAPVQMTEDALFELRWQRGQKDLRGPLRRLYGRDNPSLQPRLKQILANAVAERSADLKALDLRRDLDPEWFLSEQMVAYVFYIDRFAGTVADVPKHIDYLKSLGVTYAHMMPCLKPRPGANDGGYAVQDYHALNPSLGTMDDFEQSSRALRDAGISPCIDMVLNHTAFEHEWAQKACAGDPFYQNFYLMFDDREIPDAYEAALLDVFPDQAPGNFTFDKASGKWVWTTFNTYQWDLNWANEEVFLAILEAMLFLANKGVEILRLDAVAFMWKHMGTTCQNLPPVHDILQALAAAMRIAAPAVIHKAEAIVAPDQLVPYLGIGPKMGRVSHLAYQNSLMVQFWSALAARDTSMMTQVMRDHFPTRFPRASWATYIRCHDDIGWAVTDNDAAYHPPMQAAGHRTFLADFYAGRYPMSFATGADFQVNEVTGDKRTNGTFASLAGLEKAIRRDDPAQISLSVARILMGTALIASYGGIPLLYMGDEIGMLNDQTYLDDPALKEDGRWMQRPEMDWTAARATTGPAALILQGTRTIMAARKATPQLAGHVPTVVGDIGKRGVFVFEREADDATVLCCFNFTEQRQDLTPWALKLDPAQNYVDCLTGDPLTLAQGQIALPPYAAIWLRPVV